MSLTLVSCRDKKVIWYKFQKMFFKEKTVLQLKSLSNYYWGDGWSGESRLVKIGLYYLWDFHLSWQKRNKTNTTMCQLLLLFIFIDLSWTVCKIIGLKAIEMAQWLRAFTVLAQDLIWLPAPISEGSQTSISHLQGLQYPPSSGLCEHLYACGA